MEFYPLQIYRKYANFPNNLLQKFSTYNLYCYFRRAIAVSIKLKIPHLTPIIIIPISIWIVCILFLFLQKYLKLPS